MVVIFPDRERVFGQICFIFGSRHSRRNRVPLIRSIILLCVTALVALSMCIPPVDLNPTDSTSMESDVLIIFSICRLYLTCYIPSTSNS